MNYADLFSDLENATDHSGLKTASHLSASQQLAVTDIPRGATVVIAGPGSGKTTVLVERVAYLLANGVAAEDLLVCTFTRAASEELQGRLGPKLRGSKLPYCGTMHSLAYRMLGGQQWLVKLGLTLISEADQLSLLHSLLVDISLDDELSDKELLLILQRAQEGAPASPEFALLAETWELQLEALGYIDFVMLLKRSLALPSRRRFRFALTDEAQDLTPLQLAWLRAHCTPTAHTYLVGDDDQAVYAFRGSARAVLADEVARGAKCFQLQDNWRCRKHIIEVAQTLIAHNSQRVAQPQLATRADGDVTLARFGDEVEELAAIKACKLAPVVLCRTRHEVERFALAGVEAYTMHESKGREWPFVWVTGLEQGVCPHALGDVEEERRLFYVAVTRAKDRLVVASRLRVNARGRQASQFLKEAGLTG